MRKPIDFPPDPGTQALSPGEVPRAGTARSWGVLLALVAAGAIAMFAWPPSLDGTRTGVRALLAEPPAPQAAKSGTAPGVPAEPHDDRARPVSFYFARWGVNETQSPVGWTSRIEIRAAAGGSLVAKVWVTCPKGHCDAGEFPVAPVAHLQKKDQTAFLSMQRREGDRVWTLLLRPAPGRPDDLERWEWYGPPGTEVKTQSVLGHVRRMRPDGTFH